jgi:HPt (histidine-containing phosphotransfer) domain-containing protein
MLAAGMSSGRIEIDFSVIEELANGDPEVVAELVTMFVRHTSETIRKVRAALDGADFAQAAQIAHTCIGFTAALGISGLVPTLRAIERASQQQQRGELARHLAQWESEFAQACQDLSSLMKKNS